MNRTRFLSIVAVLILVGVGVWIARNTDWVDTVVPLPLKGEALVNPFYAAERFSRSLGATTTRDRDLGNPGPDSVIVATDWQWNLTASRRAAVEQWVEAGGRLVVDRTLLAQDGFEPWSGVGQRFGRLDEDASRQPTPDLDDECPVFLAKDEGPDHNGFSRKTYRVCDADGRAALTTTGRRSWSLDGRSGTLAARVQIGRGSVTAINARPFLYRSLMIGDHASLFVAATQLRRGDQVHFLSDGDQPSLLALLWRHGWPFVVLALALMALGLWRGMVRFGPLAAPAPAARRSLAEQILGTGRFTLRHGGGDALHAATVRALSEAARRRVAGFERLSADERAAALARLTDVDRGALTEALYHPDLRRPHRLLGTIALLESARRRTLLGHKRSLHGTE